MSFTWGEEGSISLCHIFLQDTQWLHSTASNQNPFHSATMQQVGGALTISLIFGAWSYLRHPRRQSIRAIPPMDGWVSEEVIRNEFVDKVCKGRGEGCPTICRARDLRAVGKFQVGDKGVQSF